MLSPASDSSPASWIVESVHGFAHDVGSVVPPLFGAYLRLFHPAWTGAGNRRPVTWSEVARANGRTAHAEMQFHALVPQGLVDRAGNALDQQPGLWDGLPNEGTLELDIIERLLPVLRGHTQTPERCWFAFWDGWGVPVPLTRPKGILSRVFNRSNSRGRAREPERDRWRAPKFSIPNRDLLLFVGSLDHAVESFYEPYDLGGFQSPYFWWPDDRAWCVATEIDFMSTYIGASEKCVEATLQAPGIEALPAGVNDRITGASDTRNPNPFAE